MEQTPSLAQALAELGAESKAARFRAALPEIEAAIQRGATHASILNTLAAAGLQMNLNEFRVALHRARKAIKKGKPHARHPAQHPKPPTAPAALRGTQTPSTEADGFDYRKHRNSEIDW